MKKNNKGFTLAELLIVVAIIAVLVAIAIPVFTNQLEKSREATDLANVRSAYAECVASVLNGETTGNATYTDASGTNPAKAVATVALKQAVAGWATTDPNCAGVTLEDSLAVVGKSIEITVTDGAAAPSFGSK